MKHYAGGIYVSMVGEFLALVFANIPESVVHLLERIKQFGVTRTLEPCVRKLKPKIRIHTGGAKPVSLFLFMVA